jgi:sulfonate transport system ATP-binding protein
LRATELQPARKFSPAGISIKGLTKRFGSQTVLQGLDLNILPGQFIAIIGRSGSGKSTLLRLLAGLDRPDRGDIVIDTAASHPVDHPVRMMFQEPRLLPWARVLENVQVGFHRTLSKPVRRARADHLLTAVGLWTRQTDWPSILSGGQKQRVALARALASEPLVLALDEPLGALDSLTRIEMQGLIEATWQREGFTAVLVTHDVTEAVALADRVILLEEGKITFDLMIDLPRPRRRGSAQFAACVEQMLERLHLTGQS